MSTVFRLYEFGILRYNLARGGVHEVEGVLIPPIGSRACK